MLSDVRDTASRLDMKHPSTCLINPTSTTIPLVMYEYVAQCITPVPKHFGRTNKNLLKVEVVSIVTTSDGRFCASTSSSESVSRNHLSNDRYDPMLQPRVLQPDQQFQPVGMPIRLVDLN